MTQKELIRKWWRRELVRRSFLWRDEEPEIIKSGHLELETDGTLHVGAKWSPAAIILNRRVVYISADTPAALVNKIRGTLPKRVKSYVVPDALCMENTCDLLAPKQIRQGLRAVLQYVVNGEVRLLKICGYSVRVYLYGSVNVGCTLFDKDDVLRLAREFHVKIPKRSAA